MCRLGNKVSLRLSWILYLRLPGAYIVIHSDVSESPTMTAIAPLSCMYLTFDMNEQPPLFTRAIQSLQGNWTTLHPCGSSAGSMMYPILPFCDILGPNAALLSSKVSFEIYILNT